MENKASETMLSCENLRDQLKQIFIRFDEDKKKDAQRIKREMIQECVNRICIKYAIEKIDYRNEELMKRIKDDFDFGVDELSFIEKGCKDGKKRIERITPYEHFRKATWSSKNFPVWKKIYIQICGSESDGNYSLSEDDDINLDKEENNDKD